MIYPGSCQRRKGFPHCRYPEFPDSMAQVKLQFESRPLQAEIAISPTQAMYRLGFSILDGAWYTLARSSAPHSAHLMNPDLQKPEEKREKKRNKSALLAPTRSTTIHKHNVSKGNPQQDTSGDHIISQQRSISKHVLRYEDHA